MQTENSQKQAWEMTFEEFSQKGLLENAKKGDIFITHHGHKYTFLGQDKSKYKDYVLKNESTGKKEKFTNSGFQYQYYFGQTSPVHSSSLIIWHEFIVRKALYEGKKVPQNVLDELSSELQKDNIDNESDYVLLPPFYLPAGEDKDIDSLFLAKFGIQKGDFEGFVSDLELHIQKYPLGGLKIPLENVLQSLKEQNVEDFMDRLKFLTDKIDAFRAFRKNLQNQNSPKDEEMPNLQTETSQNSSDKTETAKQIAKLTLDEFLEKIGFDFDKIFNNENFITVYLPIMDKNGLNRHPVTVPYLTDEQDDHGFEVDKTFAERLINAKNYSLRKTMVQERFYEQIRKLYALNVQYAQEKGFEVSPDILSATKTANLIANKKTEFMKKDDISASSFERMLAQRYNCKFSATKLTDPFLGTEDRFNVFLIDDENKYDLFLKDFSFSKDDVIEAPVSWWLKRFEEIEQTDSTTEATLDAFADPADLPVYEKPKDNRNLTDEEKLVFTELVSLYNRTIADKKIVSIDKNGTRVYDKNAMSRLSVILLPQVKNSGIIHLPISINVKNELANGNYGGLVSFLEDNCLLSGCTEASKITLEQRQNIKNNLTNEEKQIIAILRAAEIKTKKESGKHDSEVQRKQNLFVNVKIACKENGIVPPLSKNIFYAIEDDRSVSVSTVLNNKGWFENLRIEKEIFVKDIPDEELLKKPKTKFEQHPDKSDVCITVAGNEYCRQSDLRDFALIGGETEVTFSSGIVKVRQEGNFSIIEAEHLVPSHIGRSENPVHFWLKDAQPRDRSKKPEQPELIANELNPREITGEGQAYTGAPVINARGEVIQGNGRSMALKVYWKLGNGADKANYRNFLKENFAHKFKNYEDFENLLDNFAEPVLVRMVEVDDAKAIELGKYTVSDNEVAGDEQERVIQMFGKLENYEMSGIVEILRRASNRLKDVPNESVSLNSVIKETKLELFRHLKSLGLLTDKSDYTARTNGVETGLKASSIDFIKKGLVYLAFKNYDQKFVFSLFTIEEIGAKTFVNALQKSILELLIIPKNLSFNKSIGASAKCYIHYLKFLANPKLSGGASKQNAKAFETWLNTGDLMSGVPSETYNGFQIALVRFYAGVDNKGKARTESDIIAFFKDYYTAVAVVKDNGFLDVSLENISPKSYFTQLGFPFTEKDLDYPELSKDAKTSPQAEFLKKFDIPYVSVKLFSEHIEDFAKKQLLPEINTIRTDFIYAIDKQNLGLIKDNLYALSDVLEERLEKEKSKGTAVAKIIANFTATINGFMNGFDKAVPKRETIEDVIAKLKIELSSKNIKNMSQNYRLNGLGKYDIQRITQNLVVKRQDTIMAKYGTPLVFDKDLEIIKEESDNFTNDSEDALEADNLYFTLLTERGLLGESEYESENDEQDLAQTPQQSNTDAEERKKILNRIDVFEMFLEDETDEKERQKIQNRIDVFKMFLEDFEN